MFNFSVKLPLAKENFIYSELDYIKKSERFLVDLLTDFEEPEVPGEYLLIMNESYFQ